MAIEIVYFHKTTCDFPVRYVKVYQRVAPKYGNFIGFDPSPYGYINQTWIHQKLDGQ
jgi:hypothetical protein